MIYQTKLSNGIRVVAIPYNTIRSVSIGIWIRSGPVNENAENNGVSHFIEHLLFKGTKRRTAKDIAVEIDEIGGELNAYTGRENICLYTEVLDIHLERAVDIMSDMLQHSVFDADEIEREKTVILDEIGMYEDSPEDVVDERLHQLVYEDATLAMPILGSVESVSAMTRERILAYFSENVVPENIVISACGNFEPSTLHAVLTQYFSALLEQSKPCVPAPVYRDLMYTGFTYKKKNIELNHFSLAFAAPAYKSDRLYAYLLLNTLIGGSVSSRLFQNIREKNGLTYTIESTPVFYSESGFFSIYFTTVNEHVEKLADLLSTEIKTFKAKSFTAVELHRAKNQMISSYLLGLEYSGDIMNWLGKATLFNDPLREKDEVISLIDRTTLDEVNALSEEIFSAKDFAISVIGKTGKTSAKRVYASIRDAMRDKSEPEELES